MSTPVLWVDSPIPQMGKVRPGSLFTDSELRPFTSVAPPRPPTFPQLLLTGSKASAAPCGVGLESWSTPSSPTALLSGLSFPGCTAKMPDTRCVLTRKAALVRECPLRLSPSGADLKFSQHRGGCEVSRLLEELGEGGRYKRETRPQRRPWRVGTPRREGTEPSWYLVSRLPAHGLLPSSADLGHH